MNTCVQLLSKEQLGHNEVAVVAHAFDEAEAGGSP